MALYVDSPVQARGRWDRTIAAAFFLLSLVILYLPGEIQGQLAAVLRATILRPFVLTQEVLAHVRLHTEEAAVLQARVDSLATIVATQAPLVEENRHLHELLGLRESAPSVFLPASVIRPGTPGSESMFLLDVGSDQGVARGDPVIMREGRIGLVGVVQHVREGSSIGLDWSHPEFRASAMSADGSVFGMVRPVPGLFREEDRLILDGTPYYQSLEPGTLVTTSGLGGIYPRGIPIGVVEGVEQEEGQWRRSYRLRAVVERGSVTHALVVLGNGIPAGIMELFGEGSGGTGPGEGTGGGPSSPTGGGPP
jgi:rod shape-determining protein MreC